MTLPSRKHPVEGEGSPSVDRAEEEARPREVEPLAAEAARRSGKWITRVPTTFSDADLNALPRHVKAAIQTVERCCQCRCFTYAKSEFLAQKYGTDVRAWELVRKQLVDAGFILVVPLAPGGRQGTIILLLRRIDEQLPVFDAKHDSIDEIRELIRVLKTGQRGLPFAQSIAPSERSPLRLIGNPPLNPPHVTEDDELKTTTTACDKAKLPHACEAGQSSSSDSRSPSEQTIQELVKRFEPLEGFASGRVQDWLKTHGYDLVELVARWCQSRLKHPSPAERPRGVSWAETVFARWRGRPLDAFRAEVEAEERKRRAADSQRAAAARAEAEAKAEAARNVQARAEAEARFRRSSRPSSSGSSSRPSAPYRRLWSGVTRRSATRT